MPYTDRGKIYVPYLEYNITEHCNLRCRYCSQFGPYNPVYYSDIDVFIKDIEVLSSVYHAFRFRFVGGEPLLHKRLLEFIEVVRKSGIADRVVVCSNGRIIHTMGDEFYSAIDELDISWYPASGNDKKLEVVAAKCAEFGVESFVKKISHFEIGSICRKIEDEKLIQSIFDSCRIAHVHHCHTFYNGYYYKCSKPLFVNNYLDRLGLQASDFRSTDGLSLHEPELLKRLIDYLQSDIPLQCCKYCLGTAGKRVPWRELKGDEIKNPRITDTDLDELIDRGQIRRTLWKKRLFAFLKRNRWLHPLRPWYVYIFRLDEYWDRQIGVGKPL